MTIYNLYQKQISLKAMLKCVMLEIIKKYYIILMILIIVSCSTNRPDLEIKKTSLDKIEEIEKLNNFILADFNNLLKSCKQHTGCYRIYGEKCYFPSNSSLLHKYLHNQEALEHLDYLTDNNIITGNIDIRSDSAIRFQVKFEQLIKGDFNTCNDTVYLHEIVYHISQNEVYEQGEYIIVKSKQIKPNWTYFITKHWVD